jgi:hypothetical protein
MLPHSSVSAINHQVRKLIKAGILNSEQIMPDAPHQIRAADLASEQVVAALKQKGRPCRVDSERAFPETGVFAVEVQALTRSLAVAAPLKS